MPEAKVVKHRVRVDTMRADGGWREEVARLEHPGAALDRDVDERPDAAHRPMPDPEGDEVSRAWHRPAP